MTSIQMGQLSVTPAITITSTCSGSPNTEHWKSVRFNMHILCMSVYLHISVSVCIKSWWYLIWWRIHVFWSEEQGHTNSASWSGYFGSVHVTCICISPASHINQHLTCISQGLESASHFSMSQHVTCISQHLTCISQGLANNDCGRASFIARFRCVQVARYDLQDIIKSINCVWQVNVVAYDKDKRYEVAMHTIWSSNAYDMK